MKTKSLKFTVLDEDSVGADFLGEYRLKLSTIKPDTKEAFSIYLQNKSDVSERKIILLLHISPPIM
jgi:hypothetical protein